MSRDLLSQVVKIVVDLPDEVLRLLCDFFEKLSSDVEGEWFRAFKRFLRKENSWEGLEFLEEFQIVTGPLNRDLHSGDGNFMGLPLDENFRKWLLPDIPEVIPSSRETLTVCKKQLKRPMSDWEVLAEIGDSELLFSPTEFAVVLADLITVQANGGNGMSSFSDHTNTFFVWSDARVVKVRVYWRAGNRGWRLFTDLPSGVWCSVDDYVFSCT